MRSLPTLFGAVDSFLVSVATAVERLAALAALPGATAVARVGCTGSRYVLLTAILADSGRSDWERGLAVQFRMRFPKSLLGPAMTVSAQRQQVGEEVGCLVVSLEETERADMMDCQVDLAIAMLASILVSLACRPLLPGPIRTPVANRAAFPRYIVCPREERYFRPPGPVTRPIAERPAAQQNLAELLGVDFATMSTGNLDSHSPNALSVLPLPRAIAVKPAKWLLGDFSVPCRSADFLTTLSAADGPGVIGQH